MDNCEGFKRAFIERREEVNLCNSIFGECWLEELREMDKHEILVRICDILGPCPSNFTIAEKIFESLKFDIAKFVLHHEYSRENAIRSKLLMWLDGKINPDTEQKLSEFCNKYLK
ncbi:MAG: hypothetical protein CVV44_13385 [Spirochaetae bacterium HGW-Spirochaetae-1]|jgi:hypothetical protein|nr:MAG: hypothetical protein CVV44_13385 [Spirochaetae bacterium HGW-Spirochaetae-1]